MALVKCVEGGRFLDDLFEASQRGSCPVASNQQRDLADVGNIVEQIDKPDLADKSSYANQQQIPRRQVLAHRETFDSRTFSE